jgi:tetratricopeptide (TPR) repeat protein
MAGQEQPAGRAGAGPTDPGAEQPAEDAARASAEHRAYEWYQRGLDLLQTRSPAAASQLLARALALEPTSRSLREALARAQFDAGDYAAARTSFASIVEANPSEDYAHFGLGMAAQRTGDLRGAVEHLALAAAMRPDVEDYRRGLAAARAALVRQRDEPTGPDEPPAGR